ncbi:glycosyltransferase involved in cell wall biosynthesis [Variovorax boronicumulans]|uniref:glycosyltransferase family 4 protein n=1 Tax=Variovorax boronicumulans TaxID=436515 RepID=UPI002783EBB8|nr:glycosyltransferase family 1 protein [Variovorax boronicumulans]MDP9912345.1 glycosyltransferase involved in cell wall biosynthesis [Variovorax boronicumulans]
MTPAIKRPRIGVDFHTFDGIYQGSRSHILGLYQEAIELAPEMDFIFLLKNPGRLRKEHPVFASPNVELVEVPHVSGVARLGWQLALMQRRLRLDLLHVQYRLPLFSFCACACTIHDTLFETHPQFFTPSFVRMSRLTSRHAVRRADLLFTVSEFSRQEIARLYAIDASRIAITTNGIDNRRFHPGAEGIDHVLAAGLESRQYLCTIGRLEPRKNHLNLLRAYALLPQPRLPLVIIGQRDFHSEEIFAKVRELGLDREVRFLENVPDQGLPALLRHAAVFVYPSHAEGFGMPVAEAMASGVPVVTSNSTSLPEVAGDAALVADPQSPANIARAIHLLITREDERSRVIQRGLLQAARFNWRSAAEVLVQTYRTRFGMESPCADREH